MTQICINKMCFEFSIYHFIFLFLLIILCNLVLNSFKSRKQRLTENLWNINYDIPEYNLYPGQYVTRSTVPSKKSQEYDELTKDYDRYNFTKPKVTNTRTSKDEPLQSHTKQSKSNLVPAAGREVPNTNYPDVPVIQLPNNGLTDYDLIKQRDLGVIANPLVPPEKRTERPTVDMTLPLLRNKYIGLPTRGSYDTYQNVGYLTDESNPDNVLKLFGRQKWPGSTQYEYYAIKSTAVDQFKVPMYDIKKQLFDGDTVKLTKVFAGNYKFMEFKQEELI